MFSFFANLTIRLLSKCNLLVTFSDNLGMKLNGEYFTLLELSEKLGLKLNTVKMRLHRLGIESITAEALYDQSALEAIRNVPGRGRPPKAKPEPAKKGKK